MSARRHMLAAFSAAVAITVLQQPAQVQLLDRLKKAQKTADAATKAGTAEARAHFKSAVDDAAKELVQDGSFVQVLSPWSSSDGAKRSELARVTGTATAIISGSGYQIILCDATGARPWSTSFTVQTPAAAAATASPTANERAGTTAVAGTEFTLPSSRVTVALNGSAVKTTGAAEGSFKIASVSRMIYAGVAKLTFASVTLLGDTAGEPVQVAAVFRARIQQAGEAPASCGRKS